MHQDNFVDEHVKNLIEKIKSKNQKLGQYFESNIIMNEDGICYKGDKSIYKQDQIYVITFKDVEK